jgi:hypothetical protein
VRSKLIVGKIFGVRKDLKRGFLTEHPQDVDPFATCQNNKNSRETDDNDDQDQRKYSQCFRDDGIGDHSDREHYERPTYTMVSSKDCTINLTSLQLNE